MDQNNLVSPEEIIEFLDQQTISEEKATGLRLLRRAANTITSLSEQLEKVQDLDAEREQHLESIRQRDLIIESLEKQLSPHQIAMQQAALFGRALVGLSYENDLPKWVVHGAREIIEYTEQK